MVSGGDDKAQEAVERSRYGGEQAALALLPVLTKRLRNAEREDEASAKH